MAPKSKRLKVVLDAVASKELDGIWIWNAQQYGVKHADRYYLYLRSRIDALGTDPYSGRPITDYDLRFLLIRRRPKGHGHVAIYAIEPDSIQVLHVFHTAQNWREKIDPTL